MLYIVATPIGNLEDITLRAIRVLKEVDFVLSEDTRQTKKLLSHFDIKVPTISFHEHSKENTYKKILEILNDGKKLALVTDAGTPAISDPGSNLVKIIRQELPDVVIVPVPGPSALTTAISVAALPGTSFYFAGFAPHKKGRKTFFQDISKKIDQEKNISFVFYESPHRILKALEMLDEYCGDKTIFVAREMTKIYEETVTGSAKEVFDLFSKNPEKIRGEFVVIVY